MSSRTVSQQAREMAKAIMREIGIEHPNAEQIISEGLEFYASTLSPAATEAAAACAQAFRAGQQAKFEEIIRGFVGSHLMLLVTEGRTQEQAIRFVEETLDVIRKVPAAIPSLAKRLDEAVEEAKEDATIANATRPSSPPKDKPS